jgi:hypothetical protein
MFRTPYPVRIKVSIFNQSKIFNSLLFFLMTVDPSFSLLVQIFLLIICPQVFILPIILDEFLNFRCFSLDFQKWIQKLPLFFSYGCCRFLVRKLVFMLYKFFYLYLGPIFFKCIIFAPTSFFSSSYN